MISATPENQTSISVPGTPRPSEDLTTGRDGHDADYRSPGAVLPGKERPLPGAKKTIVRELSLVLLTACIARLVWMFMVPLSEAPDEPCHIWVAQFLCEHARLPHVKDILDAGYAAVYGPMPQMGYIVHAVCGKVFAFLNSPYCFRQGSLLMGLVSVLSAYLIGYELFPRDRTARLSLPLLMTFHPQLVFVQAYTNNDATVSALGTAITFVCVRFIMRGISPIWAAGLGCLLGWLALSKFSSYALFLEAAIAFVGAAFLYRTSLATVLKSAVLALSLCAATSGWWFVRQLHEYPTDLLGTQTTHGIWISLRHVPPLKIDFWQIVGTPIYWQILSKSYLGVFGYMKRYMWESVYSVYGAFAIIATMGGIRALVMNFTASRVEVKDVARTTVLLCSISVCVVATLAAITYAASQNFPVQGRYLLCAEAPVLLLLIYGLRGLGPRIGEVALVGIMAFNLAVYLGATTMLYPVYGIHFTGTN